MAQIKHYSQCPPVDKTHVTILDLGKEMCRFPSSNSGKYDRVISRSRTAPNDYSYTYCGKPAVADKPYCSEHMQVCYTPVRQKRIKQKGGFIVRRVRLSR